MAIEYQPTRIVSRTSPEAKKQSRRDGFAHALLGMGFFAEYARDVEYYQQGYSEGLVWRAENNIIN